MTAGYVYIVIDAIV